MENFEDHSAPPSPDEKDSGFFMLRKDSERRATLHHILTEDRDKVVANLMEALTQVGYENNHLEGGMAANVYFCSVKCETLMQPSASPLPLIL